jgi:tRNA(Ile)-lysidine synthetase-like protein
VIRLNLPLPREVTVACSGGADSMAVVDFLRRGKRKVKLAYFDHGTDHGLEALAFLKTFSANQDLELVTGQLSRARKVKESPEEFWREERYRFLHSLPGTVVTAHHLDDVVEQWIFSSLHGKPGLIPIRNKSVLRPFLLTKKSELLDWCVRHRVPHVEDPSNASLAHTRNFIRHRLVPGAFIVNPGLHKVVAKMVRSAYARSMV